MNKTLLGVIVGLIFAGILIFSINSGYSILQMVIGFVIYIIPSIFLSSFQSRTLSFILTVLTVIFIYVCIKFGYQDTWAGVALALTLGLPIYLLKIKNK